MPLLTWLIQGAVGPALVGLPVTWAASDLANTAGRWFRRSRRSDGLSRIVRAAAGDDVELSGSDFAAVRQLLEDEATWVSIGRDSVEDLAVLIGSRLRDLNSERALLAGRAIARGLLEFAVRDLEPDWFGQVLFARLERLQSDQGNALDLAMAAVHADLMVIAARQEGMDADRFARLALELGRILDRLPPGPAGLPEIALYLAVLSGWLNTDPWPQHVRFGSPPLAQSNLERKLTLAVGDGQIPDSGRVLGPRSSRRTIKINFMSSPRMGKSILAQSISGLSDAKNMDCDELGRRCARLVVLGGPGSGKTWLARRTARLCAEAALQALAEGESPDQVELPLYTTCARLAASPANDGIRRAVVASALGQLPDLGSARVLDGIRVLFEERNAPTLLVADSLDEASEADDRIRQADTLPPSWRIMLTSRPGAWDRQLAIRDGDPACRVGFLRPFRYPEDVEPFVAAWFSEQPGRGTELTAQIRSRPELQQAATVPLILAFYCIVGGSQPLPSSRADLFSMVIKRMITGRWRSSRNPDPDPHACLAALRSWAWSAAAENAVSGTGTWADEFPTARARKHSREEREAMDHVAVPLGPADPDTDLTLRRFVHRSIREHLVAEHIALTMPTAQASAELIKHLWFDPDWEIAAPAALAMHPEREQVLQELIYRATGGGMQYDNLAAIDRCNELRLFLDQVADESSEDAWSPQSAELIGRSREHIALYLPDLSMPVRGSNWPTSNQHMLQPKLALLISETHPQRASYLAERIIGLMPSDGERAQARRALLHLLAADPDSRHIRELTEAHGRLAINELERAQARHALLELLTQQTSPSAARELAKAINELAPTDAEIAQVLNALLELLAHQTSSPAAREVAEAINELRPAEPERAQARKELLRLLASEADGYQAWNVVTTLAPLKPTEHDRSQARQALFRLLAADADAEHAWDIQRVLAMLALTESERAHTLQDLLELLTTDADRAGDLPEAICRLTPSKPEEAQARGALLRLLDGLTEPDYRSWSLASAISKLNPDDGERTRVRQALLRLLDAGPDPEDAWYVSHVIGELGATAPEKVLVRQALLRLLDAEPIPYDAGFLVDALNGLGPEEDDRAHARQVLLGLLEAQTDPAAAITLSEVIRQLEPDADEEARARRALFRLLTPKASAWKAHDLVAAISKLKPDEKERTRAAHSLLGLLTPSTGPLKAEYVARTICQLAVSESERAQGIQALLRLLTAKASTSTSNPCELAAAIAELKPGEKERAQTRQALLALLTPETHPPTACEISGTINALGPAEEERTIARQALLRLLPKQTYLPSAAHLVKAIIELRPGDAEKAEARQALLAMIAGQNDSGYAGEFSEVFIQLDPTTADIQTMPNWPFPPGSTLLAVIRQNSPLPAWLTTLPLHNWRRAQDLKRHITGSSSRPNQ